MSEEEQIILPDGFKRVEYLESSGTQWLETNIKLSNKCKVVLDCIFKNREFKGIYGYYHNKDSFAIYNNSKLRIDYGGYQKTNLPLTISLGKRYIIERDGNRTYVDGDLILTQTEYEFESRGTAKLFWTGDSNMYATAFKVYRFTIYKEEVCILNFIPCLDENNIPCMYDLVSQKPFYNQGSGRFLIPKDFEWNYPVINNNYNLPAGFKKCVYLQSNGTQWIDTGVVPNNETGIYFKALQLFYGNFIPFGVQESANTIYPPRLNGVELYYRWGISSIKMFTLDKACDLIFHSSSNLYNSKILKFDSEDTDVVTDIASQTGTFTLPIWLFSYNLNGSYDATYGKWSGRIYRAQITQGDALIHDYVPCLDANGRPCMYDLIESEALYNQSGGTEFAYCVEHQLPSDFIKLKYLESDSDLQHIKTGYIPTNNTGMYVDAYNTVVEDRVVMGMQNTTYGNDRMWIGGVMKSTYGARYGWGTVTTPGGNGDVRFEASLNWLNDKKSIITCPVFAQKVNTLGNLTFTPNQDIYIFGWNRQGSFFHWKGRIYRAKISEGSEIVRDFVPAFDDLKQKPCMYDLINNVAYYNDGEGEFLYNKDVEGTYKGFSGLGCIGNRLGASEFEWDGYRRVAYLESNGNQWIDTGIIVNSPNIDIKIIFSNNNVSKNRLLQAGTNFTYILNWASLPISDTQVSMGNISTPQVNVKHTARFRKNEFILNDVKQKISSSNGYNNFASDYTHTAKLFSFVYPTAEQNYKSQWFSGRVYSCELALDGILLRNFIPCLDPNNKPCMFDIITQQPFYNQGDGKDFTYGII